MKKLDELFYKFGSLKERARDCYDLIEYDIDDESYDSTNKVKLLFKEIQEIVDSIKTLLDD